MELDNKDLSTQLVQLNISDLLECIENSEKISEFMENFKQKEQYTKLFSNSRELSTVIEMRNFHNWIKSMLIINITNKHYNERFQSKQLGKNIALLDISVGRGGDLAKWDKALITHVFGFDPNVEAINSKDPENPGAKERLKNYKFQNSSLKKSNVVFDVGYATMPTGSPGSANIPNIAQKITDFLNKKKLPLFDLVSCQFSLHYFFVSEIALRNVLSLVSMYLKPGGYFFGTGINGKEIIKYFNLAGNAQAIRGKLYQIDRFFDPSINLNKKPFGNKYNFTIFDKFDQTNYFNTIPQSTEYLVNFDTLNNIAREYSLEPVNINFFEKTQEGYSNSIGNIISFEEIYKLNKWKPKNEPITLDELQISFLNTAFVFQKKIK
jgi:mRNA (guanine-N7-)-methyltransferase